MYLNKTALDLGVLISVQVMLGAALNRVGHVAAPCQRSVATGAGAAAGAAADATQPH